MTSNIGFMKTKTKKNSTDMGNVNLSVSRKDSLKFY